MKNFRQSKKHFRKGKVLSILVALILFSLQGMSQTITIDAEPAGPLYVGDTIEFDYTATGFSTDAVFHLYADGDTLLATNANATGTLTAVVPAGYGNQVYTIEGYTGDPNGVVETRPMFGELDIAGSNTSHTYDDELFLLYFGEATIRRVALPAMDLSADTAIFEFDYDFDDNADTLNLVVEYSTDGTTYTALDTVEFADFVWHYNYQVGLPAAARTASTTLRVRQMHSELINYTTAYNFSLQNFSVYVGSDPGFEGDVTANGGFAYTVNLPYTDVTNVTAPADEPYFGNAYLGDSVYVYVDIVGFTSNVEYEVVFNETGNANDPVYELASYNMENVAGDSYLVKGVLPAEIPFNNTYYFWVIPYTGASYEHGISISHDFTGGAAPHTVTGGTIDATYGAFFSAANIRELVTTELMVSSGGSVMVEVSRFNNTFSPDNAELVVEYTTDGSTYTEMGTINLNGVQVYTSGTTTVEVPVPAGAISNATQFRVRQRNINNENLDQYYIRSIQLMTNSTRLVEGVEANYYWDTDYVNDPVIELSTIVVPEELFYPGTSVTLDYEVLVGNFTAGTEIQGRITNYSPNIILGTNNDLNSGSINATIPAIQYGTYTVYIVGHTAQGLVYSNSRQMTIEEVDMSILTVTGDPLREVDGSPYYFAGDELTVTYNLIGTATNGVQLQIQNSDGDWITIGTDNPADETVSGMIPLDEEFNANPDIRLALDESVYTGGTVYLYSRYPDNITFPEHEADSGFDAVSGNLNPDNYSMINPTFASAGTRSVETVEFDLTRGYWVYVYLYLLDGYWSYEDEVNKVAPIEVQYSTDGGSNWTTFETYDHADYAGSRTYVTLSTNVPDDAISTNTKFRVIQNEDGTLAFGENAWEFRRFAVQTYSQNDIVSGTAAIDLQQASISLGTLAKSNYGPGEAITVPYNVVGNFGSDVSFVIAIEDDNNEVFVLDTSSAVGQVQVNTTIPVNTPETSTNANEFDLVVMPYTKTAEVPMPIIGFFEELSDDEEDILAVEGGTFYYSSDYIDLFEEGRRSVLTKALPQIDGDSVILEFDISFDEQPYPAEGVVVEMTTDGGSSFTVLDTVWESDNYELKLATADINDQTHIRWVQYVNFGAYEKDWELWDVYISSENTNIIFDGYMDINQPAIIEIDYPNFPSEFTYNEQEDVLYSGESFALDLGLMETAAQFSGQTEYHFYLGDGSGNIVVDYMGDTAKLGMMTGLGSVDLTIPSTIYQDQYQVLVTIQIDDPDSDEPFVYYELEQLMWLDIYNPLLKTITATEEAYRGNDVTVNWELQTGSLNTDDFYFHLLLDNEVIATSDGAPAADFTGTVPTDAGYGNENIEVVMTTSEAYFEGDSWLLDQLNDDEWRDIQQGNINASNNLLSFYQTGSSANRAISQDFVMTHGGSLSFMVSYPETGNEFIENNTAVVEYSSDGGATYTVIDEFPNEDDYELGDGYESQMYYFAPGEIGDTVRFRISRQNANYGVVYFDEILVTENSNEAPVNFVSDNVQILQQSVVLGDIPSDICPGDQISLDYAINGVFGEDVIHYLQYSYNNGGFNNMPDMEYVGLTDGSGQFVITMPEDWSGGDYAFRVRSYDATTDNDFTVNSIPTEESVYMIPPITYTNTYLSGDQKVCADEVVTYNIYNTQPFFIYQARNVETGELYGDAVISEAGGMITMTTEAITEDLELEIVVTATNEANTVTCETGVLTDGISFEPAMDPMMFSDDDNSSVYLVAEASVTLCEGNPEGYRLAPGWYDEDGDFTQSGISSVKWYRGDRQLSTSWTLSSFDQTGSYFAKVMANGCEYTLAAIEVEVLSVPDMPTVTASGATTVCAGEIVTLTSDQTYPYYRWYGGSNGNNVMSGSSQSIEVTKTGVYRVVGSDHPIENGCFSASSEPMEVTVITEPNANIQVLSGGMWVSEDNYVSCGDEMVLRVNNEPSTYSWTLNGNVFSSTDDDDEIVATQTGYYNVRMIKVENGVTCTYTTEDSIYVHVTDGPNRPELTLVGDEAFCSGQGSASVVATSGYAGYMWYHNSQEMNPGDNIVEEDSIGVYQGGDYSVAVVDTNGCMSMGSKEVEIDLVSLPTVNSLWAREYDLCGAGSAVVRVNVQDYRHLTYQLVDVATGAVSGAPGQYVSTDNGDYIEMVSDTIEETTEFAVMVTDQSAAGCTNISENTIVIDVNTAEIEIVGNRLIATSQGATSYQWYRNGDPIMGTRGQQSYLEVYDGAEYTVAVTFGFDCVLPASMNKNATGIDESFASTISYYPNPVQEALTVELDNSFEGEISLEILDVAGKVVYNTTIQKHAQYQRETIPMDRIEQGVYMLHFITDDFTVTKSIIKE